MDRGKGAEWGAARTAAAAALNRRCKQGRPRAIGLQAPAAAPTSTRFIFPHRRSPSVNVAYRSARSRSPKPISGGGAHLPLRSPPDPAPSRPHTPPACSPLPTRPRAALAPHSSRPRLQATSKYRHQTVPPGGHALFRLATAPNLISGRRSNPRIRCVPDAWAWCTCSAAVPSRPFPNTGVHLCRCKLTNSTASADLGKLDAAKCPGHRT